MYFKGVIDIEVALTVEVDGQARGVRTLPI